MDAGQFGELLTMMTNAAGTAAVSWCIPGHRGARHAVLVHCIRRFAAGLGLWIGSTQQCVCIGCTG